MLEDTGTSESDRITQNGEITVSGLLEDATWEYSTDGGNTWHDGAGDSFTLAEGDYAAGQVLARQTLDGKTSEVAALAPVTVDQTIATASVVRIGDNTDGQITMDEIRSELVEVLIEVDSNQLKAGDTVDIFVAGALHSSHTITQEVLNAAAGSPLSMTLELASALYGESVEVSVSVHDAAGNEMSHSDSAEVVSTIQAIDDMASVKVGETVSGNLITGEGAATADLVSFASTELKVSSVSYLGQSREFSGDGQPVVFESTSSKLVVYENGDYSFTDWSEGLAVSAGNGSSRNKSDWADFYDENGQPTIYGITGGANNIFTDTTRSNIDLSKLNSTAQGKIEYSGSAAPLAAGTANSGIGVKGGDGAKVNQNEAIIFELPKAHDTLSVRFNGLNIGDKGKIQIYLLDNAGNVIFASNLQQAIDNRNNADFPLHATTVSGAAGSTANSTLTTNANFEGDVKYIMLSQFDGSGSGFLITHVSASTTHVVESPQFEYTIEDVNTGETSSATLQVMTGGTTLLSGSSSAQEREGSDEDEILIVDTDQGVTVEGGGGDDVIYGGPGNDVLLGDLGNDTIYGGAGDDWIVGGGGNDVMTGDAGADVFEFNAIDNEGADTILDFSLAEGDKLAFINAGSVEGLNASWNAATETLSYGSQGSSVVLQGVVIEDVNAWLTANAMIL